MTDFNIVNIIEKNKELSEEIDRMRKKFQEEVQGTFKQVFDMFYEKWKDDFYAIYWTQYTPYFNDGEACEFSVRDFNIALDEEDYDEYYPYDSSSMKVDAWNYNNALGNLTKANAFIADPNAYYREQADNMPNWMERQYSNKDVYYQHLVAKGDKPHYVKAIDEYKKIISNFERASGRDKEFAKDWESLRNFLKSVNEEIFESMFGDHVVVEYRDGKLTVEEYSHD